MNTETVNMEEIKTKLLSYQIPHWESMVRALQTNKAILDTSDTGTGKTYVAIATAASMSKRPVVICPKPVISAWASACAHFGVTNAVIVNYERAQKLLFYKSKFLTLNDEYVGENNIIIFDEVHRCKGLSTINSKMLIASFFSRGKLLLLSATPASSPIEMRALGFVLGLHNCKNFPQWLRAHGCEQNQWGGWEYYGKMNHMEAIRRRIAHKTFGMRIAEIPSFPTTQILTDPINLNGRSEKLSKAYEIIQKIKAMEEKDSQNYLVELLRARQTVETLKLDAIAEMAEDAIEQGFSVAIFVNFNDSVSYLMDALKEHNPVSIVGGQGEDKRQAAIEKFQQNNTNLIVCNIRAGGVGVSLHDPNGIKQRYSIISPNFSAIDLKQALGRVHRSGGARSIQRIVFAADTIEVGIARVVRNKLKNMEALTDNDLI